ncbi:hypothetical protein PR048_012722 [Dryococelus australis]|uniref:HTH CENPB-type domain-containing protein n=1 Tax=Dryococelus australis TaxID=614101 RepID=A0ABQ9HQA8_9NEOP|nr:hypothetical protein PR048_012722 [Dryococelus australis]
MEQKLLKFIIDMKELGFGLAVYQVQELAYKLAKTEGREHLMSDKTEVASKWWWNSYKERYGLSLRILENLSAYRASMSNATMINNYFEKVNHLLTTLGIKDNASHFWNVHETGLRYVVKPNKIMTEIGKCFVNKRVYADRAEMHTLVGCICADGTWIPPFVIFKGVWWNDNLSEGSLANSRTRLSPKGWITSELFLEWFQFFIHSIPPNRPVVLFMDSHSSHITPEVIELAHEQDIFLLTFPSHTSHLLEPFDVGVYRALKCNWSKQLNSYVKKYPDKKPNNGNFYKLFNPAFTETFIAQTIQNSFERFGIMPLNKSLILIKSQAPTKLIEKQTMGEILPGGSPRDSEELIIQNQTQNANKKRDGSAKCHNPPSGLGKKSGYNLRRETNRPT